MRKQLSTKGQKSTETGRSILEMLAVLAAMALLTMGGIKTYHYVMDSNTAQTIHDDVMVRALLKAEGRPHARKPFTTELDNQTRQGHTIKPAEESDGYYYTYEVSSLTQGVCYKLLDQSWKSANTSPVSIKVNNTTYSLNEENKINLAQNTNPCTDANAFTLMFKKDQADRVGARPTHKPCQNNNDCSTSYKCENGVCTANCSNCPSPQFTCWQNKCVSATETKPGVLCPENCLTCDPDEEKCTTCKEGYFLDEGICTPCPANATCANGQITCDAGYYLKDNECLPCEGDREYSEAGATSCSTCPAGQTPNTEHTGCKNCDAGETCGCDYGANGNGGCYVCEPNTTNGCTATEICNASGTTCFCPDHATCANGQITCDTGYYKEGNECKPCDAGYYLKDNECLPCEAGTYKANEGNHTCTECLAGQYQNETGKTSCKGCPDRTYTDGSGSGKTGLEQCKPCPAGQKHNEKHTWCTNCQKGDTNCGCDYGANGNGGCYVCEPKTINGCQYSGKKCNEQGTACNVICDEGWNCACWQNPTGDIWADGNGGCIACPTNANCNNGEVTSCKPGYAHPTGSNAKSCITCAAGYYKSGSSCTQCGNGKTSPAGSTSSSQCYCSSFTTCNSDSDCSGSRTCSKNTSNCTGSCVCNSGYTYNSSSQKCCKIEESCGTNAFNENDWADRNDTWFCSSEGGGRNGVNNYISCNGTRCTRSKCICIKKQTCY